MPLPKSFTTVTPFTKTLALAMFIIFPVLAFWYGSSVQKFSDDALYKPQIASLQKQVAEKENEIQRDINNQGQVVDTYSHIFSYAEEAVASPLFINKPFVTTEYAYKRNTIIQRSIDIPTQLVGKDHEITYPLVTIWEFPNAKGEAVGGDAEVIFDGYENNSLSPTSVPDIMKQWQEAYTTKHNLKMHWIIHAFPGHLSGVALSYLTMSHQGTPLLLSITCDGFFIDGTSDPLFIQAKQAVENVADSITFHETQYVQ